MVYSALLIFPFLSAAVRAANDWNTPCFQGECSYDLPASGGSTSGSMKIWGSQNAISDITPAAGWTIMDCSPDKIEQDIRLVCNSDETAAGCGHLEQNIGAVGKIIRLPEECGKNAFARVSNIWVPTDQSIPAPIAARLVRRDGSQPQVKALSLDTNFNSTDTSKTGNVSIAIKAASVAGLNSTIITPPAPQRRSRLADRGFLDFVGNAIGDIGNAVDQVFSNNPTQVNLNKSTSLPPVNVDTTFNLLHSDISCPSLQASVNVDVHAKADAEVNFGVAVTGTIFPPKFDDFGIFAEFSAHIDSSLDLVADISGTLDSGPIKIFEIGIPGLDFPGILTIGPSFQVNGQATANLDVDVNLNVGVQYNVDKARLVFPPKADQPSGSFNPSDTPLQLSVSPSVSATGNIEAHLIPSINLGISALGNFASASVFVELDAHANLQLQLKASAQANITAGGSKATPIPAIPRVSPVQKINKRSYPPAIAARKAAVAQGKRYAMMEGRGADIGDLIGIASSSIAASSTNVTSSSVASSTDAAASSTDAASSTGAASSTDAASSIGAAPSTGAASSKGAASSSVASSNVVSSNVASSVTSSTDTSSSFASSTDTGSSIRTAALTASPTNVGSSIKTTSTSLLNTASASSASASNISLSQSNSVTSTSSAAPPATSASVSGCIDISIGLDVNAGAQGSFFGLFDATTKVNLFTKNFDLFNKCFGASTNKKRFIPRPLSLGRRAPGLSCLNSGIGSATSLADLTVNAANIKAV